MPIVIPEMTPQQQAEAVINTESREHERQRKAGDRVFLISATWFATWCEYTGHAYDPQQRKLLGNNNNNNSKIAFADSIQEEKPRPGPIDCSDLLDPSPIPGDLSSEELALAAPLRPGLKEKEDFWILHEATWQLLKNWYGCTGPEISREYISVGGIQRRLEVHHDQWHLKAVDEHSGRTAVLPALRMSTVAALKDAVFAALDIEVIEDFEIAAYPGMTGEPQTLEDKMLKTLVGVQLQNHQAVLVRRKDHPDVAAAAAAAKRMALMQTPTSTVPMSIENNNSTATTTTITAAARIPTAAGTSTALTLPSLTPLGSLSPKYKLGTSPANLSSSPLSRSFSKAPSWAEDAIIPSNHRRPGLAGLGNLGNTCFMNSSLQCLVHSMPLIRTFLNGAYRADLNRDNPLGLGGKLAAAFGGLMGKLWQGGVGHVSPKHFKWQLGKFAPQFGGYAQQDSQELLAFLLDGLHEDLNRIQVKPYFEEKDDDRRPDSELAAEAWDNYRARNDSVIVDHFQGLYKSSLRCPGCGRTSVKFDPFMYLSLPLPTPITRTLTVIIVDAAGNAAPLQVSVEVMKTGTIGDVLEKVAACCVETKEIDKRENEMKEEDATSAQHQWLLAQWSPSTGVERLTLFRDPKLPVSSIKEPVKSTFLFSSTKPATLLAYRFSPSTSSSNSSQGHGPESGFRPIVVFHKTKYTLAGVPTVLYLPTKATAPVESTDTDQIGADQAERLQHHVEELALERQKTFSSSWALISPNMIEDGVASFMKPFFKQGVDHNILIKGADSSAADKITRAATEPATEPTPMLEGKEPVVTGIPAAENGREEQEDVGMTDAVNETSTAPSDDASIPDLDPFLFSADTNVTAADADAAVDGVENMAVDGESKQAGITANSTGMPAAAPESPPPPPSAAAAAAQPGVSLILAKPNGEVRPAIAIAPSLGDASVQEPLYFLVEWSDEIAAEFLDLTPWTAPILHESAVNATTAANAPPRSVTLNDCVDAFLQPEKLDASDSWYCTGCKSHVQAEKKLDLWRLPEVLVVHLKRFSYSRYSRDKLDTEVDFPLQGLDLRNVVPIGEGGTRVMAEKISDNATTNTAAAASTTATEEDNKQSNSPFSELQTPTPAPLYDLYAVSNHYGGLGGGHYTAYCRMPDDGKWYTFDDSSVVEMNPNGVRSPAAYVLFYRRRGAEAQDGDIERVIESARENDISKDGAGGTLPDIDLFTGGFNGSCSGGQLTPRRVSGQLPALEQVNEEGDEENADVGSSAAALALDNDDEEQLPALLPNADVGGDDDEGMEMGTTEDAAGLESPQHQPSLAAHALPLDDLDDINMDDI